MPGSRPANGKRRIKTKARHGPSMQTASLLKRDYASYSWRPAACRQVSWLTDRRFPPPSRSPSDIRPCSLNRTGGSLPAYSDEFVQDLHLFPFSPDPGSDVRSVRHLQLFYVTRPILAFRPVPRKKYLGGAGRERPSYSSFLSSASSAGASSAGVS